MAEPLLLSTWSFGIPANAAAWEALSAGGNSLDAVEAACRYAEADPENHTVGLGGWPDSSGRVSLDASIMLAPDRRGAVAALRRTKHAVSVARCVMERTPHVLIVGEDADAFARSQGFPDEDLLTEPARARWEQWRNSTIAAQARPMRNIEERTNHDTIGALSIDCRGVLAGACSTSGLAFKLPGRVGDSPIVGHGLYVDPVAGAAVATGHGELVMGVCGMFLAVEEMRRGATPLEAAERVLRRVAVSYQLTAQDQVGMIVVNARGEWASGALREGFRVAVRNTVREELVDPEVILFKT